MIFSSFSLRKWVAKCMEKFWKSEMGTDFVFFSFFLNSLHSKDAEKPLTTYLKLFLKKDTKSYFSQEYLYRALNHVILNLKLLTCLRWCENVNISHLNTINQWFVFILGFNWDINTYLLHRIHQKQHQDAKISDSRNNKMVPKC